MQDLRRKWYLFKMSRLSVVGLVLVLVILVMVLFGVYIAPYPRDDSATHVSESFEPPSLTHFMGTDHLGRDILSRVILGARISVTIAVQVMVVALGVGVPVGLLSGYVGGSLDSLVQRIVEMFMSIPSLVLALVVAVALGPGLQNMMIAIGFTWWPIFSKIVRGEVLHVKEETYIEASRSFGGGTLHIAFTQILPNIITPVIIRASIDLGSIILTEAALGFLGFGAQPPTPEWGTMTADGRLHLPTAWWMTVFPGTAIFFTVLAFNMLGDGLRDAFAEYAI
jgi:peptide/nickel transport system permease protein